MTQGCANKCHLTTCAHQGTLDTFGTSLYNGLPYASGTTICLQRGDAVMSVAMDGTAPYAPVENVLLIIRRFRERSLPNTLDTEELTRLAGC